MKRLNVVIAALAALILAASVAAAAQGPMSQMQRDQESAMGPGMTGMPMGGMMCPMMGGGMGMGAMMRGPMGASAMGMMPMMGSGPTDPQTMARMLQLRGDILKAVGEVLTKHGRALEQAK